jgi:hypothetical protein
VQMAGLEREWSLNICMAASFRSACPRDGSQIRRFSLLGESTHNFVESC